MRTTITDFFLKIMSMSINVIMQYMHQTKGRHLNLCGGNDIRRHLLKYTKINFCEIFSILSMQYGVSPFFECEKKGISFGN